MPEQVKPILASRPAIEPVRFEPIFEDPKELAKRVLFLPSDFSEVVIPYNDQGQMLTPIEVDTGVPLPIAPSEKYTGKNKNRHHTFFFAMDFINGTIGQQATRLSRLQRVNKKLHKYAHLHLYGALLPSTPYEEFRQTVLGYAGYVPRFGLKFDGGEFGIVELTQNQLNALRRKNTFSIERGRRSQGKYWQVPDALRYLAGLRPSKTE